MVAEIFRLAVKARCQGDPLFPGNERGGMAQRKGNHHMHHIHSLQSRFQNRTDRLCKTDAVFCHIVVENSQIPGRNHIVPWLPRPVGIGAYHPHLVSLGPQGAD